MLPKLLRSMALRTILVAFVLLASGFVLMVGTQNAAAQSSSTTVVIGLQNDMPNLNNFDPATNTVWKAYQIGYNFETLLTFDPDYALYADLADPAHPTGSECAGGTPGPGYCVDSTGFNVTVWIRTIATFTDGKPMTPWDVIFSYQALTWSTLQNGITQALWWQTPRVALWNATANGLPHTQTGAVCTGVGCSHIGVEHGTSPNSVVFHLVPQSVSGVPTPGAYALFFFDTLVTSIIPIHIWKAHINGAAQINPITPVLPNGQSNYVTDTFDRSIDFTFGAGASPNKQATIGTGPFQLNSWVPGASSQIQVSPTYWGSALGHMWRGTNYGFKPAYLKTIDFVVFGSLDVVSLAIQQGSIDTMIWTLTPGFLSQVQYNPAITVEQVTDSGFFYMAFNMRKPPWNDNCLRTAISMAIDKQYIVNILMGGFGTAGTVPISIANPLYVNRSAQTPPFDKAGASTLLDSCGYHVNPATGFRTTPSGQPISTTILTPPKDYDPVRADAGIMISNNLKSIGLDISAAPTSFDTIVAKAFTKPVDFDIYILGFLLGFFPETYICSFFCSFNDVNLNPAGSNSAGYHNATVDNMIQRALITVDTNSRVKLLSDVEGILSKQLPWNVLYYRKNLNAFRNDRWVGWVNTPPQLYNFYSLVNLRPAGTPPPPPPPSGALSVAMTVPERAIGGHTVPVNTFASQNGVPVQGATVWINATLTNGLAIGSSSATTNAAGMATVNWFVPVIQGVAIIKATAVKGGSSGTSTKQVEITVGPPAPMATLRLSTATPVIHPGGTATVTATLHDGQGNPIAGRTVSIDTTLIQGTLDKTSAATNATGIATFTYSAPATAAKFPNAHLVDTIRANVSVPNTIAAPTQSATLTMVIQNDNAPVWKVTSIPASGISNGLVLNHNQLPTPVDSTAITVQVSNYDGTAASGVLVAPAFTDTNNITVTPVNATTGANGQATFTVAGRIAPGSTPASFNSTVVQLRFTAPLEASATSDSVELLLANLNSALNPPGYAALITFDRRTIAHAAVAPKANVTVTLWDHTGALATNVPVLFQIGYGSFGMPAEFPFTYDWGTNEYLGSGLDLNSFGIGIIGGSLKNSTGPAGPSGTITQGPAYGVENFANDFEVVGNYNNYGAGGGSYIDSCDSTGATFARFGTTPWPAGFHGKYYMNATSKTGTTGAFTAEFFVNPDPADSPIQVSAWVQAPGSTLNITGDACAFTASIEHSAFHIDAGVVAQRAPVFAVGSVATSPDIMTSTSPTTTITAKFYALNGAPAANVQVFLVASLLGTVRNVLGFGGGTMTTDGTGTLTYTLNLQAGAVFSYLKKALPGVSQPFAFNFVPADPAYAYGGKEQLFSGGFGTDTWWSNPNFEVLLAKLTFGFSRGYLYVPTTVDFASASVPTSIVAPGASLQVTVVVTNGVGDPIANATVWSGAVTTLTDATGKTTLTSPSVGLGSVENLAVVTTPSGQIIRAWYGVMAANPILTYGTITPTPAQAGSTSTFTATVTNTLAVAGTASVSFSVDNQTIATKQVSVDASGTATVSFSYVFPTSGSHVVTIGTQSTTVSIAEPPAPVALYALAGSLLVAGLVVGVVVGRVMGRRRKPPASSMEEHSGDEPKSAEEELRPDEQL